MATPSKYHRPTTLDEAFDLSLEAGSVIIAGGALTLDQLDIAAQTVIDVQAVPELNRLDVDEEGATIGAAVKLEQLLTWDHLPEVFRRALTRALPLNQRNNISILESLHQRSHPLLREWLAAITAHDIGVQWRTEDQQDWTPISSLFSHAEEFDKLFLLAVDIPAVPERQALGSAFVARTPADAPIVNAAVYVYLNDDNEVESMFGALCGASAEPVIAFTLDSLIGNPLNAANIASAVKSVAATVEPVGDYLGSIEYRREMARVCVERALTECSEQLNGTILE
ncbi:MAG: FAD binding domain-containing protein [Anaerolinea sp.]|nr:FAD binding domain-containing protein [Anaerolinea sp.]